MNPCENCIIVKGQIKTQNIDSCVFQPETRKYIIHFHNTAKPYSYNHSDIIWIRNPAIINPNDYQISHRGKLLFNIVGIYEFTYHDIQIWHIRCEKSLSFDYEKKDLEITKSCLTKPKTNKIYEYLRTTAEKISIESDEGVNLLSKQFNKINFIAQDTVFSVYTEPERFIPSQSTSSIPIFPFGCNASQYKAVKNALENQISVIEGPPGTGKTQTILNILANLTLAGKTVQIVSNNNSAISNVYEKMASYELDFFIAPLGKQDNKKEFMQKQTGRYPKWITSSSGKNTPEHIAKIKGLSAQLQELYIDQERLSYIKQEHTNFETENYHFLQYLKEVNKSFQDLKIRYHISSSTLINLWNEYQRCIQKNNKSSFLFKTKCRFRHGIASLRFYKERPEDVALLFQYLYYATRLTELTSEIRALARKLSDNSADEKTKQLQTLSMEYFRDSLSRRYGYASSRTIFKEEDLRSRHKDFLAEYPTILSTTFSARGSLCAQATFDYIIIDEASQVDIATGALAVSGSHNAVIVGDMKQLPNVITDANRKALQDIFNSYSLDTGYNFAANSFLQSICEIIPKVPRTLLREHYRCHPQIINFCNQKFYHGNLIIMTKDDGRRDAISIIKTVAGNHAKGHLNQRQVDIITQEVLPSISYSSKDIGIIAPYKDQVGAIAHAVKKDELNIATVHKFQGREKDAIIISTVDDTVTNFSDDPNLLNVAVSRAKKRLWVIVSGNEQKKQGNISDLIDYAEYNNLTITQSTIRSVFDLLYSQYTKQRIAYLNTKKKISEFDSENIMFALLTDIIGNDPFTELQVICHQPVAMLLRDITLLNEEERTYASHYATHLDFLLYNRISKKPVLAIEVDGYRFHKEGTMQSRRDQMKNHIMELYKIPLLRLGTNGSEERRKITDKLMGIYQQNQ